MCQKNFGRLLKKLREEKNLSQNQLAKDSKLTSSAISQFESNLRKPSFEALIKLSKTLDVSSDYLLGLKKYIKKEVNKMSEQEENYNLAKIGYTAYCDSSGWYSQYSKSNLPQFDDLKEETKNHWIKAAQAIKDKIFQF